MHVFIRSMIRLASLGFGLASLMGASASAGTVQITTSVYQLDSSEPGLPNYVPSVAIPPIETIDPNHVPADATVTFTYTTPNGGGAPGIVQGSLSGKWAAPSPRPASRSPRPIIRPAVA